MVDTSTYTPRSALADLIPPGWEVRHGNALQSARTAGVEIWTGPADGTPEWVYDPLTKTEVRNHGTLVTTAMARVQRLLGDLVQDTGTQDVSTRQYLVVLPWEASWLTTRTHIRIMTSGDPLIDGRYMSVVDPQGGSLRFERHVVCEDNLEAP